MLAALLPLAGLPGGAPAQSSAPIIRYESIHHPTIGRGGMVVSQSAAATRIGRDILARGGNAADAAVAVGFALAVVLPRAGNIGGSGFMLHHQADEGVTVALDFRSAAPAAARREDFVDETGRVDYDPLTFGPRAAGVPGTVAGLESAWRRFGSLPWAELVEPARRLAAEGFEVSDDLAFALEEAMKAMRTYPASRDAYSRPDGGLYRPGDVLRQPDLAWSLSEIARDGADAFYRGAIAERIVGYMERSGGHITAGDLADYRVREREPIETVYRGHRIVTMPPSSVGGIALLQMLNVLSRFDLSALPQGGADSVHLIAETMKRVNANRRQGIGDTDFVDVPVRAMLSRETADAVAAAIDPLRAADAAAIAPWDRLSPFESRDTTHYSIVDADGDAAAVTYTLGYSFGSAAVAPGTGILLDNQMRNFSHREPGHANAMAPGKRMVSTMTPTLAFDPDGELLLVTGTPGGSRIHTSILQLLVNVIDYGRNVAEATHLPRVYQGWRSPELGLERGVGADAAEILETMGHDVRWQQTMGSIQSIMLVGDALHGAADPRRPGALALGVR